MRFRCSIGFVVAPLVLAALGGCARSASDSAGPADPARFTLRMTVQPTSLGVDAVSGSFDAERPWTELRRRSYAGDSAAAWLPGALLAERFELPAARIGVRPQLVFAAYLVRADEWDSLRAGPRGAGIEELKRASRWAALFQAPRENPYAAGSDDARRWERFRVSAEQARGRIQLVVPPPPPGSWDDSTAAKPS